MRNSAFDLSGALSVSKLRLRRHLQMALWYAAVVSEPLTRDADKTVNRFLVQKDAPAKAQNQSSLAVHNRQGNLGTSDAPSSCAFDILEKKNAFELITDVPGFSPSDISVELEDGVLTVSTHKQHQQLHEEVHENKEGPQEEEQEKRDMQPVDEVNILLRERQRKLFSCAFKLPDNADPQGITASLDNGVLTVRIAKLPEPAVPGPRRIQVKTAAAA